MMNSIVEEITPSDCIEVLKRKLKCCNFEINSSNISPLDEVKGLLGDYCHLEVNYCYENKCEKARFFVKIKSTSGFQQDLLTSNGLFTKECQFYQKLVCDISDSGVQIINDCIPQCYLVSNDMYLIFEDLEVQGYINLNTRDCPSLDCVKSGLDALAKLHASGLIYEEKMKRKTGVYFNLSQNYAVILAEPIYCNTEISKRFIEAVKEGTETLINLNFENINIDVQRFKQLVLDVYDNLSEATQPSTLFKNTICHCDLWSTNIMSKFENGKAVRSYLIDFQTLRYGPPAQDFMTYLYFTTDKKFRQEHMQHLIQYYYEKLVELFTNYDLSAAKVLPREEFVESCNHYRLLACALATNHHQLIMLPPNAMGQLIKQGILQNLIFGGRPEVISDFWKKDDFYRERMKENIAELRDLLTDNQNDC